MDFAGATARIKHAYTCTYDEVNLKRTITDDTGMAAGQSGPMIASYGYMGRRAAQRVYGNDTVMTYAYDGTFNQPDDFGVRQVAGTTVQVLQASVISHPLHNTKPGQVVLRRPGEENGAQRTCGLQDFPGKPRP